jgi:hypothetical protein
LSKIYARKSRSNYEAALPSFKFFGRVSLLTNLPASKLIKSLVFTQPLPCYWFVSTFFYSFYSAGLLRFIPTLPALFGWAVRANANQRTIERMINPFRKSIPKSKKVEELILLFVLF